MNAWETGNKQCLPLFMWGRCGQSNTHCGWLNCIHFIQTHLENWLSLGMALSDISMVPFSWLWPIISDPILSNERRGEVCWKLLGLYFLIFRRNSQVSFSLPTNKETWSPTVYILQPWKKFCLRLKPTALGNKGKKKPGSFMILLSC